jgi:hypothetical protein
LFIIIDGLDNHFNCCYGVNDGGDETVQWYVRIRVTISYGHGSLQ